jgi:hypothetical protein
MSTEAQPPGLTREQAWAQWGAPTEQVGSVNDPRAEVTDGLRWNELWIYRVGLSGAIVRRVLWHRYDFVAVLPAAHSSE